MKCETMDCDTEAARYVTCQCEGAYPYCQKCADLLIHMAGETDIGSIEEVYVPGEPEAVSPDDPLINGNRWREERDRYKEALTLIASPNRATYDKDGTGALQIARRALKGTER